VSAKVDQFCDRLRDRLNAIEGRLQSFKTSIRAMPEQAEQDLRDKLEAARAKVQAQKKGVDQARARLKAQAQQKVDESKEAVSEWQAKRETRKLNARADHAETYAADAIDNATASIDEAEEAILYAAVARLDADAVS
jgi:DNA repair exonuclease SbcCD ATPase subunit